MSEAVIFIPVVIFLIISFVAAPLINMFKNAFGEETQQQNHSSDAKYDRRVHQMHIKDAAGERKHRLDQLKSLYEAGMMEKDEYLERIEALENEYRVRY